MKPSLTKLKKLKFLYLGSNPSVTDLEPITQLEGLAVLYLENFKRIEDYSPLTKLKNLEQLVISGPTLNDIHIQKISLYEFFKTENVTGNIFHRVSLLLV